MYPQESKSCFNNHSVALVTAEILHLCDYWLKFVSSIKKDDMKLKWHEIFFLFTISS